MQDVDNNSAWNMELLREWDVMYRAWLLVSSQKAFMVNISYYYVTMGLSLLFYDAGHLEWRESKSGGVARVSAPWQTIDTMLGSQGSVFSSNKWEGFGWIISYLVVLEMLTSSNQYKTI